jgi:two-component system CheB/CheR fusion protein
MADDDNSSLPATARIPRPVIVGIGASAGGIRALQAFFAALSEAAPGDDTGAAFVVIVHLDPQSRSELAAILAMRTRMPVSQVADGEHLQPNHVYVIPPDRRLRLTDHEIATAEFDEPRGRRAPIDLFFRSLAQQHGDGFAVILSGAGADGAVGVREVKETGGIILVQDPTEAEYPSMPRSAIATGIADLVLPVRDLATRLVPLIAAKREGDEPQFDEELLRRLLAHLRVRTGHDFTKYKRSTVLRRLLRRMQVTRTDDLGAYYEYLRDNPEEAQALLADLLISVTTFFRDGEAFEALKRLVIPQIMDGKELSEHLRIWVPGCATGEEAYTVAMILLEEAARRENRPSIQVFGSDLDAHALTLAREGLYPAAIEADVSEERLRRFFVREGDHYRVRRELRDIVLFASHSVLKDPPFSRIDLVSCRNLLIYLDRELQQQVASTFHYALNPGGFLLLGSSETADNPSGLFRTIDRKARIYQSTATPGDKPRVLPRLLGGMVVHEHYVGPGRPLTPASALNEAALHRQALERVAPPSVLVDESHRVMHLSEQAGRFLQPSGGPLTGDIVDLVRSELRFELRSALHRVFELGQSTLSLPILVQFNGSPHRVHLQVKLATGEADARPRQALVMFIEGEAVSAEAGATQAGAGTDDTVRRLSEELALTQARLRTTREESEAANEELRAANEELQSINEEYRSTSEELETSKEELQSINEELQTVNSELKLKLDAVSRAHSDLQNLMAATDVGTLFLDSTLRIKRFTKPVTELFRIMPADEGRPVTDFAHQLEYEDLVKDAEAVIAHLTPIRREVKSRGGRWYDLRLRPYRTVDDKIDGVVITFLDVTERLDVERALRLSEQTRREDKRLVEISHDPIFVWDFDGGILEWNRGSEELYGYTRQEAIGKRKDVLLGTTVPGSSFAELRAKLLENGTWSGEVRHHAKSGRELTVESRIVLDRAGDHRLALESTRDITERKGLEERQRMLMRELAHRINNTLAVVQAIAHHSRRHATSPDDFIARFDGRLRALGSAHALLVESDWAGADLGTLAHGQLDAHAGGDASGRLRIAGDPVTLPVDVATPFGLILHELATNAVKHGALSRPGGSVTLGWSTTPRDGGQMLSVVWRETGGPPVTPPTASGRGGALIESALPGAVVRREFHPDGLVCTIEIALTDASGQANGSAAESLSRT